jgi:hypothetical protein
MLDPSKLNLITMVDPKSLDLVVILNLKGKFFFLKLKKLFIYV